MLQGIDEATKDFPAADMLLGECLAQSGRMDDAVAVFRNVLVKRPDFISAHFQFRPDFVRSRSLRRRCGGVPRISQTEPGRGDLLFRIGANTHEVAEIR